MDEIIVGYQDEENMYCRECANLREIVHMENMILEDGIADCLGWCDRCGCTFWYTADSISMIFAG